MSDLNITVSLITSAAQAQAKKLAKQVAGLETQTTKLGKSGKKSVGFLRKAFGGLGKTIKTVFVGSLAFNAFNKLKQIMAETLGFALKFEDALVGFGTVSGVTGKKLADFGREMQDLSRTIPIASDELLNIATTAARLGVRGTKNLTLFTDTIARLSAVSDLEGGRAALVLARLLNITGEATSEVTKLGSAIVKLGNNFATSESEIADVALDIARGTARFNIASKDILGIATALKETGAQSEISGSQIGFLFGEITKSLNSGGPKLEEFSRITGKTAEELGNLIDTDPTEILISLTNGLRSLSGSATETEQALNDLGLNNLRIKKVLPSLVKNYDNFRSALKLSNAEYKNATELTDVSGKKFETLSSKLKILSNNFLDVSGNLLNNFVPATKVVVSGMNSILEAAKKAPNIIDAFTTSVAELAIVAATLTFGTKTERALLKNESAYKRVSAVVVDLTRKIKEQDAIINADPTLENIDAQISAGFKKLKLQDKLNKQKEQELILAEKLFLLDAKGNILGSKAAKELQDLQEKEAKKTAIRQLAAKNEVSDANELTAIKQQRATESADFEIAQIIEHENIKKSNSDASFFESVDEKAERDQESLARLTQHFEDEAKIKFAAELKDAKTKTQRTAILNKIVNEGATKGRKAQEKINEDIEKGSSQHQSNLTVLAKAGSKEAIALKRAQNIAEIASNAPTSISNSYKYGTSIGGPVLGAVFGAIAAAAQAQLLSNATSQNFQDGGVVGGNSFSGDNVAANVNSGEVILNRQQQANTLFAISNGQGQGQGSQQQETVTNITVEIDGEAVGQTVSRQVANGLVLGENE